jgi:opacity protein-like surface antigen
MKTLRYILASLIVVAAGMPAFSQVAADSTKAPKQFKNVIRYNLSGPLLFGFDYIVFGYERVIKPNQTMSMNLGQAALPKILDFSTDDATLTGTSNNTGINFSLDYRFYLKKENKYGAPRGVYIGPFYSYNRFNRDSEWKLEESAGTSTASAGTKIEIHTIGAEVGYQFALGKRFTIDLVMIGPGVANYKLNTALASNLTPEQKEKLLNAVKELITEKFPGMDYTLEDATIDSKGNFNIWNAGYRYIIHLGFRF